MINVIIVGAKGKMGKKVKEAISISDKCRPVCGVDIFEDFSDKDFPVYSDFSKIGEKADVGLVLEIREVVNEPTDGEEDDWYQASPFEVTFLGGADFHAGSVLTVGPDQGGPVLEYIVFFPESVCFFHGKLF